MFGPEITVKLMQMAAILAGAAVLALLWVLIGRDDEKLFGRGQGGKKTNG